MTTTTDAGRLSGAEFAPPYLSFGTFRNFVASLNPNALPPRIDRSLMIGMAGGTQSYLLLTLKQFSMIGDAQETLPRFVEMTRGEEDFIRGLREILQETYQAQLKLAREQATSQQLTESFASSGYQGSTLRKAVTFFLHAAKAAEVPLSPHFSAPRASSTPKSRRSSRPKVVKAAADPVVVEAAERHSITLRSGGSVTLSCSAAFLSLTREDRDFVFDLVDRLRDYESHLAE